MIKILLTGHGGSNNRGCEAIARCTVDIINRALSPTEITIMSFDPASDREALIPDLENVRIPDVLTGTPRKYSLRWIAKGLERRVLRRVYPGFPSYFSFVNRSFYRDADVVISIGGDNFSDDYGGPSTVFGELSLARSLGSLTVIWGASIGPFHNKILEKRWARQLRKVNLITVREDLSLEYLRRIGVMKNVRRIADPAFLLPAYARGKVSLSPFRPCTLVGIGMSAIVSRYGSSQDNYIATFTDFGKALLSDANTHLVLIPHVVQSEDDDEEVCHQLATRFPDKDRVTLIGRKHNACQTKHVIAQCDYFIGARTHSTIASLSSCVPTLSIGYSRKAYGINKDIFGHTDYVLPISDLDERFLMKRFTLLRDNRKDIIKQLRRRVPVIKTMADQGGVYLREMLCSHGCHAPLLNSIKHEVCKKP